MLERWITRLVFLLALLALLIAGFTYYAKFHLKGHLVPLVLEELNKRLHIRVHIRDVDIRFLRTFPHASVTLLDATGYGHEDCRLEDFGEAASDTLFHFHRIDLRFNIRELLRKHYVMNQVTLSKGRLQLLADKQGRVNYTILSQDSSRDNRFDLDIRSFVLSDVAFSYQNLQQAIHIESELERTAFSGRFNQARYELQVETKQTTKKLMLERVPLINQATHWNLKTKLMVEDSRYRFEQTALSLNNIAFTVDGEYTHGDKASVDVSLKAKHIDLKNVLEMVPHAYQQHVPSFRTSGSMSMHIRINGDISASQSPQVQAHFSLQDGQLEERNLHIKGLTFKGSVTNGANRNLLSTRIRIDTFAFTMGTASFFKGSGQVSNLKDPLLEMELETSLEMDNVQKLLKNDYGLQGKLTASTQFRSKLRSWNQWDKHNFYYITLNSRMQAEGLYFSTESVQLASTDFKLHWFDNAIRVHAMEGLINKIPFSYEGSIRNATFALFRDKQPLHFTGELQTGHLDIPLLLPKKNKDKAQQALHMPDLLYLDLRCDFEQLTLADFTLHKLAGQLRYQPRTLSVEKLHAQTLQGRVSGAGKLTQSTAGFTLNSDVQLSGIDIQDLFRSFHAFGQEHLTHENISGSLSGNIRFACAFDSTFTIHSPSIVSVADILIENGRLHNFEMLYSLSRFIDLEELRDIRFQTLENRIEINNSQLIMPRMSIVSSALEMEASGTHSFDNTYEYQISVLLSDILSRKARRKQENTEFGVIADDGIRTMLHLRIAGQGDEYRVSYDRRRAAESVRENLRQERQELRTLFREEFGRPDKTAPVKDAESPPQKFIIDWEEEEKASDDKTIEREKQTKEQDETTKQNKKEEKKFIIEWE